MFRKIGLLAVLCATLSGTALAANISKDVELTNLSFSVTPSGMKNITGTGTNKTDHEIKAVFVKFNLLQNGQIIGQTVDMANNVKPGESWKLSAPYNSIDLKPDSFRVTEVSAH